MLKKTIIFVLIFILAFCSIALADPDAKKLESAQKLVAMGIIKGYDDGSLGLEDNLTREQFATIAVRLLNKEHEVANYNGETKFSDVNSDRWSAGYINVAVNNGLIIGRGDGTFNPEGNITHAEVMTILVRLLGYEETVDQNVKWPQNYLDKSKELSLNISSELDFLSPALRGDIMLYIDKSLVVKLNY